MQKELEILISLINSFKKGETISKTKLKAFPGGIIHYYYEIIRYWSQLNFIVKKTVRSIKKERSNLSIEESLMVYAAYRVIHEKATPEQVSDELGLERSSSLVKKLESFSWEIALKNKSRNEKISIQYAFPTIFIEKLLSVMKIEEVKKIITCMNEIEENDDFSFFILSKENQPQIFDDFHSKGIKICADHNIPFLLFSQNKHKKQILSSTWYKEGKIFLLDKASAAVAYLLDMENSDYLWDACLAPGIKSIIISKIYEEEFRIIGSDFNQGRLNQAKLLILKSKVNGIYLCNFDSTSPPFRFKNYFDKILIDAPCSGSGTFRTNPELKWKQSIYFLNTTTILQEKILNIALKYLKPNGILIYSTCSLYPEEGELQILKFIDQLEPLKIPNWIDPSYEINGEVLDGTGRLFPHKHHSQGFFIGKFKKKAI